MSVGERRKKGEPLSGLLHSGIAKIGYGLAWLVVAGIVAYLVANQVSQRNVDAAVGVLPAPQIGVEDRATISLTEQTIFPVLSSDGRVVQAEDGKSFDIEAPITPQSLAYQFMDPPLAIKAQIIGGPSGFDCTWVGLAPGETGDVAMRCRIPDDIEVVVGLPATMVLQLEAPVTVQALPLTAVVGRAQQGQVVVITPDGDREVRTVGLGKSDSFWIEITDGLNANETVLEVPVESDFSQSQP